MLTPPPPQMLHFADEVRVRRGGALYSAGDPTSHVYFLTGGVVDASTVFEARVARVCVCL